MNYLLEESTQKHGAVEFDKIKESDYLPALDEAMKVANEKIKEIKKISEPNFVNIIERLEEVTQRVDHVSLVFSNMDSAHCTDEISNLSSRFYSLVTKFNNEIAMDSDLFTQIKTIWDNKESENLSSEQLKVLDETYKSMVRNGALLNDTDKATLKDIDNKLSELGVKFSENARNATNDYILFVEDEKRLKGLPEGTLEAAKDKAKEKGKEGQYAFSLEFSSFYPLLQYCEDRELREEIYMANAQKAFGGKFDNQQVILDIISFREKRAKLLGFKNHAAFVLEERMAKDEKTVFTFIEDIYSKAKLKAEKELESLKKLKLEHSGESDYQKWDHAFYSEKLKQKELDLDDEKLRPYFKLENVIDGVFQTASKLYDLDFKEIDVPVYHKDVKTFEVTSKGSFVGLFYCDFFPRAEKRSGAWMTEYRSQGLYSGKVERPHVSIVCNFTKPTSSKPSLLTLNEVLTLFHEFGHALHGLLSDVRYRSISGPNVFWDFVELPSQILENWALEKECLEMFAKHYETGEVLPDEYIEKIKKTNSFLSGLSSLRQLSFATLDMEWHTTSFSSIDSVNDFEKIHTQRFDLLPSVDKTNFSCSFSHIFAGGYSAGYYSYKWAEVLDADAFNYFKENGIFNNEIATSFKENILSRGGSEHPMDLYKKFRGQEPSVNALLERGQLV